MKELLGYKMGVIERIEFIPAAPEKSSGRKRTDKSNSSNNAASFFGRGRLPLTTSLQGQACFNNTFCAISAPAQFPFQ
jgi:hypothetical protein